MSRRGGRGEEGQEEEEEEEEKGKGEKGKRRRWQRRKRKKKAPCTVPTQHLLLKNKVFHSIPRPHRMGLLPLSSLKM